MKKGEPLHPQLANLQEIYSSYSLQWRHTSIKAELLDDLRESVISSTLTSGGTPQTGKRKMIKVKKQKNNVITKSFLWTWHCYACT